MYSNWAGDTGAIPMQLVNQQVSVWDTSISPKTNGVALRIGGTGSVSEPILRYGDQFALGSFNLPRWRL